ncbi:MAG: hypothetical protein QOJ73_5400 [Streptosporangiaceae bacterium]|jgi:hypothetical protein|nr:hypothetical protein [Streptosporangiaceae bacterium]
MPGSLTEIVHAGFDARLRALRVPGPLVKYRSPPRIKAGQAGSCR